VIVIVRVPVVALLFTVTVIVDVPDPGAANVNRSANDGTISRFGWKAQNKSLLMFAAEAYNVEMGISNQLFPQERDETPSCLFFQTPNDTLNFTTAAAATGNFEPGCNLGH
jgi:hypothetical protein